MIISLLVLIIAYPVSFFLDLLTAVANYNLNNEEFKKAESNRELVEFMEKGEGKGLVQFSIKNIMMELIIGVSMITAAYYAITNGSVVDGIKIGLCAQLFGHILGLASNMLMMLKLSKVKEIKK